MKQVETQISVTVDFGIVKITVSRTYRESKRNESNRSKEPRK